MEKSIGDMELGDIPLFKKGKVRNVYEVDDSLLIVATDRISAFDWVLPSLIPYKGRVLTRLSLFWFDFVSLVCPNHVIASEVEDYPDKLKPYADVIARRSMLVKKAEVIPIECVVRGYLSGSGWNEYSKTGKICGIKMPKGLRESDRLEEPIFTPSTKADQGHDENISYKDMEKLIGAEQADRVRRTSLELYQKAALYAVSKGIIIADTKFEFGLIDGELTLVDEIFTPDSSRFWPLDKYEAGKAQPSLDKQFVRDYLLTTGWDRNSEPPVLPEEIVRKTSEKYQEIYSLLTDRKDIV